MDNVCTLRADDICVLAFVRHLTTLVVWYALKSFAPTVWPTTTAIDPSQLPIEEKFIGRLYVAISELFSEFNTPFHRSSVHCIW